MDEKGYLVGVGERMATFSKVSFQTQNLDHRTDSNVFSVHSGDRTWATTLEFISSRGQLFQPLVIFRGKRIQKNWTEE